MKNIKLLFAYIFFIFVQASSLVAAADSNIDSAVTSQLKKNTELKKFNNKWD